MLEVDDRQVFLEQGQEVLVAPANGHICSALGVKLDFEQGHLGVSAHNVQSRRIVPR